MHSGNVRTSPALASPSPGAPRSGRSLSVSRTSRVVATSPLVQGLLLGADDTDDAEVADDATGDGGTIVRWDVTELMKGWFTGAIPRHGLLLRDPRQGSPDPIDPRLLEFGFIDLIVE